MADKYSPEWLRDVREQYNTSLNEWHMRMEDAHSLAKGEWFIDGELGEWRPGSSSLDDKPFVMNIAEQLLADVARLVDESEPSIRANPRSESDDDQKNAWIRESVAQQYWDANDASMFIPMWAMDLLVSGIAVAVAWTDESEEYPQFIRVDPRFCYPSSYQGRIMDLLVVQRLPSHVVQNMFQLEKEILGYNREVEVWDYYSADRCVKAVAGLNQNGELLGSESVKVVHSYDPGIGRIPVAFAQLPSADGEFRGKLDQVAGSLYAKNKIVRLITEYAEQEVYAPFKALGVVNPLDPPGPSTIYQLDPNTPGADIARVEPAGGNPQLWNLLGYLDQEQRGQLAYPSSRQGDVSQSIASASFVNATQGQLTSLVKECQKYIGSIRKQLTEIGFVFDRTSLDFDKPLARPIGRKKTYLPSKDLTADDPYIRVVYGAGAGLDVYNADTRVIQHYSSGLISKETAREQIDYLLDPSGESDKLEIEATAAAVLQKFLQDPNVPLAMNLKLLTIQKSGRSLVEAAEELMAEAERLQAQQEQAMAAQGGGAPQAGGDLPLPEGVPSDQAEQEALALEKGAVPGQAEVEFTPPPMTQVLVR